jgi:hypothetical protein
MNQPQFIAMGKASECERICNLELLREGIFRGRSYTNGFVPHFLGFM